MLQFQTLMEFNFHQTLEQTEGVSIVMFSGPDCGTCRQIEKILPGVATGIVAQLFKVDAQQCMGLVRQYEVFHFPALFLFVNGYFHATLHSEVTPVKMQAAIDAALARPAEEEP